MYRIYLGFLVGFVVLCACPAVGASGDKSTPTSSLIAVAPVNPAALPPGFHVSSLETDGIYHLTLPDRQAKALTPSMGKNITNTDLKKMLNAPFSPTGVRAFYYEPEGLPPTVASPCMYDNSFSLWQLESIYLNKYLDQYVIPASVKKMIPKTSSFTF